MGLSFRGGARWFRDDLGRRYATRFPFVCRNTRAEARAYVRAPLTRQWKCQARVRAAVDWPNMVALSIEEHALLDVRAEKFDAADAEAQREFAVDGERLFDECECAREVVVDVPEAHGDWPADGQGP